MPAWIAAGASIIGGLISSSGQEEANDANLQISQQSSAFNAEEALKNREFQAIQAATNRDFQAGESATNRKYQHEEAATQMAFQERMSNTSYQRAIQDMQQAGLNPMLAYSRGGASSPSGASGSGAQAAGAQASGSQASAMATPAMQNQWANMGNAMAAAAQYENISANTEKQKAETRLVSAQEAETQQKTSTGAATEANLRKETDLRDEQIKLVREQIQLSIREFRLKGVQIIKFEEEIMNVLKEGKRIDAHTSNLETQNILDKLLIPAAKNAAAMEETPFGEATKYLKPILDIFNSANRAYRR